MELFFKIILFLLVAFSGFTFQLFSRWTPWINMVVTFLLVLLFPPFWSAGLTGGIWIACAFFTFHPENDKKADVIFTLNWHRLVLYSLWTFLGFLLTLLFIWKIKVYTNFSLVQREISAWFFLIVLEICLYKVIAQLSARLHRIPLGYGIAVLNFMMLIYWLFPLGLYVLLLTLTSLLIINPLLLIWLDPAMGTRDTIFWRNR